MAIQIDPVLHAMPQRIQDEFRREVAGSRRGPISDAVLPLNSALIDRQRRIDAMTSEIARLGSALNDAGKALQLAVRQNEHDMLLTGDELRVCRSAIARAQSTTTVGRDG